MALIAVLLIIAVLGLAAAALLRDTRSETDLVRSLAEDAKAESLADAGVYWAMLQLVSGPAAGTVPAVDGSYRLALPSGTVRVSLQDEAGKIDLNRAGGPVLEGLFRSAGLSPSTARDLVAAVEDFRDSDHDKRPNGAEDADYVAAGIGHDAKDASFSTTDELLQIKGMTPELFAKIAPALTVYSPRRVVNLETASPQVLNALTLMPNDDLRRLIEERSAASGSAALDGTSVLTVLSSATTAEGGMFIRKAVIRRTQNPLQPFEILDWRREWSKAGSG